MCGLCSVGHAQTFQSVMAHWIRALLVLGIASVQLVACGGGSGAALACSGSTTLESLVACIDTQVPKSDGYVAPTPEQRADWRSIVRTMLEGSCDMTIPSGLNGIVQVRTFTDADNGRNYCLLMEVRDEDGNGVVDHGLGAFIVFNGAGRQLSHQAVHPLADSGTESQAVTVFKKTDSRSFLMAGAHRDASKIPSTCLRSHPESDASHNSDMVIQATNEALLAYYGQAPWFVIQWHGMAAARCPNTDIYMSHGLDLAPDPTDKIM